MKLSDKVAIPAAVMAREIGGETVILDLDGGTYFGLDAVGTRIWQLLGEGKTLAEVCDAMIAGYEVSRSDIERDVIALAESLRERQLIVVA